MDNKIIIKSKLHFSGNLQFFKDIVAPELTVDNPKFVEAVKAGRSTYNLLPEIKNFFVMPNGIILIPRGYKERLCYLLKKHKQSVEIQDERCLVPLDTTLEHKISLRPYQHKALTTLSKTAEGLLVAPAGSGKTVMGICLTLMSNQKTLWLTHTHNLATQYIERIKTFIPSLSEQDVGFIGGGKIQVGNITTVGLIQTLIRRPELLEELEDTFGLVIADEVHHAPATTFTKVMTSFNAYYIFGLTATPYRRDGLTNIMYQNIGPIRAKIPRSEVEASSGVIVPQVLPVCLNTKNIDDTNYQSIITSLINNVPRNRRIVEDVINESNQGNICIVITDRRAHAEVLYELLKNKVAAGIATGSYKKECRADTLKSLEKNEINVLVCTSQLLGEGFDYPPLNRLFLTLPFRDITKCEQLVGRIQRPYKHKKDALIYDYVDITNGLLKHQFRNAGTKGCRYNVYKKLGCLIH